MLLAPPGPGERIEALTPSRIQIVSVDALKVLLSLPSVAESITDAFAEALRDRQTTIRNCAFVRHSERVYEKLLQLARTYGRVVPGGVRIDFPLTHQLLADMVGSARETVSLALSDLAGEELLDCRHHRYVLKIAPPDLFSTLHSDVVTGVRRSPLDAQGKRDGYGFDLLAWLLPLLGLASSGAVILVLARRWTRQTREPSKPLQAKDAAPLDPRLARRLDEELAHFDR